MPLLFPCPQEWKGPVRTQKLWHPVCAGSESQRGVCAHWAQPALLEQPWTAGKRGETSPIKAIRACVPPLSLRLNVRNTTWKNILLKNLKLPRAEPNTAPLWVRRFLQRQRSQPMKPTQDWFPFLRSFLPSFLPPSFFSPCLYPNFPSSRSSFLWLKW